MTTKSGQVSSTGGLVEREGAGHLLRYLLTGVGEPYVVVRLGYADTSDPLPPAPRRDAAEVIEIVPAERTFLP